VDNTVAQLNRHLHLALSSPVTGALGDITTATATIIENEVTAGSSDDIFSIFADEQILAVNIPTNNNNFIYVAGEFSMINGFLRNKIARLNANGVLDQSFNVVVGPTNGSVRAVLAQADGQVLVAGSFVNFSDTSLRYLARLNPDGTVDPVFMNGQTGPDNLVDCMALQPDGKLLIGGFFTSVNGASFSHLARLDTNGVVDPTFLQGMTGADGAVRAISVQPDGKIVIVGDFTDVNRLSRFRVARLYPDGSVDTSFNPQAGADASVRALVVQPDSKVLIGGLFQSVAGVARSRVARLNADGSLDVTFNPGAGADDFVNTIALQEDGRILIGGAFLNVNGFGRNRIARLTANGAVDLAFNVGTGANNFVNAIALQPDRKILVAGGFTEFNSAPRYFIARLNNGINAGSGAIEFAADYFSQLESISNAVVTVVRSVGLEGAASVYYSVSNGTAFAGIDYLSVSGRLDFTDGEATKSFIVPLIDNTAATIDRTIQLHLTGVSGAELGARSQATLAIVENDGLISFELPNFSVNESATQAVVNIRRLAGTDGFASVDYAISDGTATGGSDYLSSTGRVYFFTGLDVVSVVVPILEDSLVEGDETFNLFLSNPVGSVSLGRSNATVTIVDNDYSTGTFGFSIANYIVNENGGTATINVRRNNGSLGNASINYAISNNTATAGQDFALVSGTLQFADGQTVKSFTVPIHDDGLSEGNELISMYLYGPSGAQLDYFGAFATLTITDDDLTPGAFRFSEPVYYADENGFFAYVTVIRTNGTTGDATVEFQTRSGTAISGVDFYGITNVLTFSNNVASQSVFLQVIDDTEVEAEESFNLLLVNPTGGATLSGYTNALMVIRDNESIINFSAANYSVNEGANQAVITVSRNNGGAANIVVSYSTSDGSAIAGSDYTPVVGTVTFGAGELIKTFVVPVTDNAVTNANKFLNLNLSSPLGGALLGSQRTAVLTIIDNDSVLELSSATYSVSEAGGQATIVVSRRGGLQGAVSVNMAMTSINAVSGVDYQPFNGTVFFSSGESSRTITVPVYNNALKDGNKTINIALSNTSGTAILGRSTGVLTIVDDDTSVIVPAGAAVIAENLATNRVVEPGEAVTINLALRNVGNLATTNLVATLLATNGVTAPGAAQTYGALVAGGASVSRPFTFTAAGTNGSALAITLQLREGTSLLGNVVFNYMLGRASGTFASTNVITLNDNTNATPYPSAITVYGLTGKVSKVTVSLRNMNHGYPDDIDLLLVGPAGQKVVLMSDVGGDPDLVNVNLTFDDSSTNSLPDAGPIVSGTNRTASGFGAVNFPAPAPAGPYATNLAAFNGADPNGVWSLCAVDDETLDYGAIAGGWSITVTTVDEVKPSSDLAIVTAESADPVGLGTNLVYTFTVSNYGPADATNVVVSNTLPTGVTLVGASASQGTSTSNGRLLTYSVGKLTNGATATLTATLTSAASMLATNLVVVASTGDDQVSANNQSLIVTYFGANIVPGLGSGMTLTNGTFQLTLTGIPGNTYVVEVSTNLVNWVPVYTNRAGVSGVNYQDTNASSSSFRFYRLIQQ
jgi:uncharacterized repeat protein (TIGR01451 family)/uncharacterized delta-60 repeat protein